MNRLQSRCRSRYNELNRVNRQLTVRMVPAAWAVMLSITLSSCVITSAPQGQGASPRTAADLDKILEVGLTAGLPRLSGEPKYAFEQINHKRDVLYHQPVAIQSGEAITFSGWAAEEAQQALASGVDIVIDGQPWRADYGGLREDVANYFQNPSFRDCGFRLHIPAGVLPKGRHEACVRVVTKDLRGYREGAKVVVEVL
jgi:hypothetical protein